MILEYIMKSYISSAFVLTMLFSFAGAASAQQQQGGQMQNMPGMDHSQTQNMPGMDHSNMAGMNMQGMDHSNMPGKQGNTSGARAAPLKPSRPGASTQGKRSN